MFGHQSADDMSKVDVFGPSTSSYNAQRPRGDKENFMTANLKYWARIGGLSCIVVIMLSTISAADTVYTLPSPNFPTSTHTVSGTITILAGRTGALTATDVTGFSLTLGDGTVLDLLFSFTGVTATSTALTYTSGGGVRFDNSLSPTPFWLIQTKVGTINNRVRFQDATIGNRVEAGNFIFANAPIATPEPASLTMLVGGLGLMGLAGWRRRRKQTQLSNH